MTRISVNLGDLQLAHILTKRNLDKIGLRLITLLVNCGVNKYVCTYFYADCQRVGTFRLLMVCASYTQSADVHTGANAFEFA